MHSASPLKEATATQQSPLGAIRQDRDGVFWRYIENTTTAMAVGHLAVQANSVAYGKATKAPTTVTSAAKALGFVQYSIPANYFGWVVCSGPGTVLTDATISAGAFLACGGGGTAGICDEHGTPAATDNYVAFCMNAIDTTTGTAMIRCL